MQLTSFTDFGLRALMRLAGDPERSFSTDDIAREFGISRNHLIKVVHKLAATGFVKTQRGSGGGFRLARPAETITIGEIVRALEDHYPLVECFRGDGGSCVLLPSCRLKARLAAAREAFFAELDRSTLAQCAYRIPPVPVTGAKPEQIDVLAEASERSHARPLVAPPGPNREI
jgi:Rrf2 family nitric oxide-sensitive transcriptional repressor